MIIPELKKIFEDQGVKRDDTLCIFSDITSFGIPKTIKERTRGSNLDLLLDSYINTLKDLVGENGLVVMPTFTYSACKGEIFDVNKTKSEVGALTEYFRRQKNVKRSLHPIFSFAAWGKDAESFLELENFDSFGDESILGKLFQINAYYVLFGVSMHQSATFVLYSEQKNNVYYRYFKDFSATAINKNEKININARYFVRDLNMDYKYSWNDLEKKGIELRIIKTFKFGSGEILIMRSQAIDKLIRQKLKKNKNYLISL
ncbi:AAC(3) family N-acetyltransferase [Candidatus Parcubacteria bacterium]|nr:AAC(3) family N-acetyltransferase [Candidatus Parcubacteria bacterium]